jgi:hypothetical protein
MGFNITEEIICTKGEKPKSACSRDSGSALQCFVDNKWLFIGVVTVAKQLDLKYPNLFERIAHYIPRIRSKIRYN